MSFENPNFLFLIILPTILWFFIKSKSLNIESFFSKEVLEKISVSKHSSSPALRLKLLILSIIFMIFAISRPVINNGEVELEKQLSELIIAVDISKSMLVSDIYPNRFEFAKNKLITSLDDLKNIQIGVIGFADQSFLVSPLTDDFLSLKTLITNLNIGNINLSGTNILSAVQTANELLGVKDKDDKDNKDSKTTNKNKQILLLTDGGDSDSFADVESYAKDNNIAVFVFDISSKKGGILKDENGALKDKNGNIVILKENLNIKNLTNKTNGKYKKYSLTSDDLTNFIESFKAQSSTKKITKKHNQELFYFPVIWALIFSLLAFFSTPKPGIRNV
jgi:Ca-activated chloride channel family protein